MNTKSDPITRLYRLLFSFLKFLGLALFVGLVVRFFLFQPFRIPSRSMEPTLIKGDYFIISRYAYGYNRKTFNPVPIRSKLRLWPRDPKRGDVVVFTRNHSRPFFVKRLIGLPGDRIQIRDGVLNINGTAQKYQLITNANPQGTTAPTPQILRETLSEGHSQLVANGITGSNGDDTPVYNVPENQFFVLGDNRDNSNDSRFSTAQGGLGFIDRKNLVGRAEFVLLSTKPGFTFIKPWTWGQVRGDRCLRGL